MKHEEKLTLKVYSKNPEREWVRLAKSPFNRLEFDTTMRYLKEYLPKKGLILDAGGGPGRYTIELAKMGYDVVLLDFTRANLDLAKKKISKSGIEKKVKGIFRGSITDLSRFDDKYFDAVLCLGGPLSHVHSDSGRKKAVSELRRVAKPGAPVFISVMGKFATVMAAPRRWITDFNDKKQARGMTLEGEDYMWHGKYYAHFFTREEFAKTVASQNLKVLEQVGLEGLASPDPEAFSEMPKKHPKAYKHWMELHYKICTNPTVVDTSSHILIVAKREK